MWTVLSAVLAVAGWIAVEWFMARAGLEAGPEFLSITQPPASTEDNTVDGRRLTVDKNTDIADS